MSALNPGLFEVPIPDPIEVGRVYDNIPDADGVQHRVRVIEAEPGGVVTVELLKG